MISFSPGLLWQRALVCMSFQNAFSRPPGAFKRDELAFRGSNLKIVAYSEVKETIGSSHVDPTSLVWHHSSLLLKVVSEECSTTAAPDVGKKTKLVFEERTECASKTQLGLEIGEKQVRPAEAILRVDWNASSTTWYRIVTGGRWDDPTATKEENHPAEGKMTNYEGKVVSHTALLEGCTGWKAPGRSVTLLDIPETKWWYDVRFNNCQHFVKRCLQSLALTEPPQPSKCLVS